MEAKLRSRKRRQHSPTNAFEGIFTRSKSQIYLDCNRSGRARSDAERRRFHHADFDRPPRKFKVSSKQENSAVDDISHISIKDLRARRVFSPASIIDECCSKPFENEGIGKFDYINPNWDDTEMIDKTREVEKFDLVFSHMTQNPNSLKPNLQPIMENCQSDDSDDKELTENRDSERFEEGFTCKSQNLSFVNLSCSRTDGDIELCSAKQRSDEDGDVSNAVDNCVHITPEVNGNGEIRLVDGEISGGCIGRNGTQTDRRNDYISTTKLAVNRCPQRKVSTTPSSFSYRRLLPFLMNTAKDNTCNSFGVSKIEKIDSGFSCKVQNSNEGICAYSIDRKPLENGEIEKIDRELSCRTQDMNSTSCNLARVGGNMELKNVKKSNEDDELGIDDMMEEHVQTTPPDADIFSKPEVNDIWESQEDNNLQTKDHILGKPLNGRISRNDNCVNQSFCSNVDQRNSSTLKSKLVLNPCSRLKVFKTPSSFSYRRLLPFLMDIAKYDPCASQGGQSSKIGNVLEENLHLPLLASPCQEIPTDTSKTDNYPIEHHGDTAPNPTDTSKTDSYLMEHHVDTGPNLPTVIPIAATGSSNKEFNLISENITEPQKASDSPKEWTLQVDQVKLDRPRNLEPAQGDVTCVHETSPVMLLCSPVNPETFPGDGALKVSHGLATVTEKDCTVSPIEYSKDAKPIEAVSVVQNSSLNKAFVPSVIPADGFTKGILKRNPRGCRGLCNCLNCASFRLHADRAFEFSRNQMQDAEEVALELITELSYLRSMLEKSAVDADGHGVVHVNQVKEACMKAFKAEELAKNRLSQMNCDLNIHCRSMCLQRPRVRFANYTDEIIPKADLQADSLKG